MLLDFYEVDTIIFMDSAQVQTGCHSLPKSYDMIVYMTLGSEYISGVVWDLHSQPLPENSVTRNQFSPYRYSVPFYHSITKPPSSLSKPSPWTRTATTCATAFRLPKEKSRRKQKTTPPRRVDSRNLNFQSGSRSRARSPGMSTSK